MTDYYTLAVKTDRWEPMFGDYNKEVVKSEFDDYYDHGVHKLDMKIIRSEPDQLSIDLAIALMNSKHGLPI